MTSNSEWDKVAFTGEDINPDLVPEEEFGEFSYGLMSNQRGRRSRLWWKFQSAEKQQAFIAALNQGRFREASHG